MSEGIVLQKCGERGIGVIPVFSADLKSPRMQNMVLLGTICKLGLLPGVLPGHYLQAMEDLMEGALLENNLTVFNQAAGT